MAELVLTKKTTLSTEETVTRAIQFFATEKFRPTSQSSRVATFEGRVPIPFGLIICTVLGYMMCVIPGIILYFMTIRKMRGFQNLIVTASPAAGGSDVSVSGPKSAKKMAQRFLDALP